MKVIKPPSDLPILTANKFSVFLAGTIDLGKGIEWQKEVEAGLSDTDAIILNPRRDVWDWNTPMDPNNEMFRGQVLWELAALESSSLVALYLAPNSESRVSLIELGLYLRSGKLVVSCDPSFSRYGNVFLSCEKYKIPMVQDGVSGLVNFIKGYHARHTKERFNSNGF